MRHRSYVNLLCSSPRAIRGSRIDLPGGRILVGGTLNVSFLCLCFSFLCRHRLVIRLVGRSGGKDIFYLGSFAFVGCYWVIFGHLIRCACSQRCFALGGTEKKTEGHVGFAVLGIHGALSSRLDVCMEGGQNARLGLGMANQWDVGVGELSLGFPGVLELRCTTHALRYHTRYKGPFQ